MVGLLSKRPRTRSHHAEPRVRSLLESLEPRLLMSATLFADAGPDQTSDEGATVNVNGTFNDTDPGTPGAFDIIQLTSDSVSDSLVVIDGDRVAWNNGGTVRLFDGTTDGGGNPNIIDLSAAAGTTSTQVTGIAIDGDRVAYSIVGTGGGVFVYDITAGTAQQLAGTATSLQDVQIDGDTVVWERLNGSFNSVFSFDLADPLATEQLVASGSDPGGSGNMTDPFVNDGLIYWIGVGTGGFTDVFAKHQATGNIFNVSNTATQGDQNIAADNGVVAWNTVASGAIFSDVYVFDGRGFDGTGTAPTPVQLDGISGLDISPAVSGANIVWEASFGATRDVFTYNVDTAVQTNITNDGVTNREAFTDISGNNIVWSVAAGVTQDVFLYDLTTGIATPVDTNALPDTMPVISGGNVAFLSGTGSAREVIFARGQGNATYQFDWDFGDGTVLTDVSLNESHAYADNGSYNVTLTVTSSNGEVATDTATVTVNNLAPQLTGVALDAAAIDEGGSVTLTGSFTDAGVQDTHTVTIDWGNGTTSNATVDQLAGTFSATNTYLDDDPTGTASDINAIGVTLTDNDGDDDTGSDVVTVNNLAPVTAAVTGPTQAVRGQTLSYTGSFTDAGTLDTHTETWTVTDASSTVIATGTGSTFDFAPDTLGSFTVTYTVTDDDTGTDDSAAALTTALTVVTTDPIDPSQTTLFIGGSDNSESIKVFGRSDGLKVKTFDFATNDLNVESGIQADRIVVYANGGNDFVKIFNSVGDKPADLFGGEGNDWLRGGKGDDAIVGGNGNDFIGGADGRDLLIGGDGTDFVIGHRQDDILIAGSYTGQDDLASLRAIMALWLSPDDYATRVGSLSSTLNDTTVSDDGNFDLLLGLQGQDFFMFNDQQDLTDQRRNELMTDTEIDFLDSEVEEA